jgi:CubicO group peptidase (beta-lactamase class C family)
LLVFVLWCKEKMNTSTITSLLNRFVSTGECTGLAVVALQHNELALECYAGSARPGLVAGPNVLWPLASISKVYSAAAIMRLVEYGSITLNTLVSRILPEFVGEGREEIRLRHLLTHTAGMIYESPNMEELLRTQTPLTDMLSEAITSKLLFTPGTAISYADYHYLVAGAIAERIAGQPFAGLVQSLVLEPAGLQNTFFPPAPAEHARIAHVQGVLAEGTPGAMYNSAYGLGLAHPAFGVVATTHDLARFASYFMPNGPRIHSEPTVQAMISDQTGGVPGSHPAMRGYGTSVHVPWGLGWYLQRQQVPAILTDLASFQAFGHGGASGCLLIADPQHNLVVAITSNTHVRTDAERWRMRLQSIANSVITVCSSHL